MALQDQVVLGTQTVIQNVKQKYRENYKNWDI